MEEKSSKDKIIATHYAELNRLGANAEYERALKCANKILGLAPHEALAFHSKIVCMIQLSKFEEAISLINKNPQYAKGLIFEKAYCHYRANKPEDALKTIESTDGELDLRIKELRAQILYKLEKYKEAVSTYQDIIKNVDDEYEDERYTNLSAALVYVDPKENDIPIDSIKDVTYELCYNKACIFITNENYFEAEKKLKLCEKMCRESLEEDEATEDEINVELALIRIQLAYVYQKQGRIKESHQLYTSTLKTKIEDISLIAVASNNIVSINKEQNLFDSKKKMKSALNEGLVYKLSSKQRKLIALNNAIFNYYINQTDQCEKICKSLDETCPEFRTQTKILRALNLVKIGKSEEAVAVLEKPSKENDNLYMKLCIAQLYLMQDNIPAACQILEHLGQNSYKPAIVGALTTLYLGNGQDETALKIFEKTVDFYKKNNIEGVDLSNLWRQAAEYHIKKGLPHVAANSLEELLRTNRKDKKIIAQLIMACAQFSKEKALALSKDLPSAKELSKGLDLESLYSSSTTAVSYSKKAPSAKQDAVLSSTGDEAAKKRVRRHKKKKGKLPKNCDPNLRPDPERWLPKYERTGYRKKRDRRAKDVIKGSQGTASGQADQFDFSSKVTEDIEGAAANEPTPKMSIKGQQHQQKKSQQKGKKKRR